MRRNSQGTFIVRRGKNRKRGLFKKLLDNGQNLLGTPAQRRLEGGGGLYNCIAGGDRSGSRLNFPSQSGEICQGGKYSGKRNCPLEAGAALFQDDCALLPPGPLVQKGRSLHVWSVFLPPPHQATDRRPLRNGSTGSHSDRLMTRNEDPVVAVVWHSFSSSLQIGPTNLPPPLLLNQTPAYRPPLCLGCGPGGISPSSLKVKFSGRGGEKGQFLVLDRTFLGKKPREKPILLCSSFPLS